MVPNAHLSEVRYRFNGFQPCEMFVDAKMVSVPAGMEVFHELTRRSSERKVLTGICRCKASSLTVFIYQASLHSH